jgi:hypothetical protein
MDAVRRLLVGALLIPVLLVVMAVLFMAGLVVWLVNNGWALLVGSPLFAENSRVGYYFWWAQSQIQHIMTGRGDLELP